MTVLSYRELLYMYMVMYVQVGESGYLIAKGSKEKKLEITNKYHGLLTVNLFEPNCGCSFRVKGFIYFNKY